MINKRSLICYNHYFVSTNLKPIIKKGVDQITQYELATFLSLSIQYAHITISHRTRPAIAIGPSVEGGEFHCYGLSQLVLMQEKPYSGMNHYHTIFIRRIGNFVIPYR
jgi:hypothetical protein